jgi:hypothetical protein
MRYALGVNTRSALSDAEMSVKQLMKSRRAPQALWVTRIAVEAIQKASALPFRNGPARAR